MTLQLVFSLTLTAITLTSLAILFKIFSAYQQMIQRMSEQMTQFQSSNQAQISQLANSVTRATTEGTTQLQTNLSNLAETLILGREQPHEKRDGQETGGQNNPEPIPGIETFDGLSQSMIQALQREAVENDRWQQLSQRPPVSFEANSAATTEESWSLDHE